MRSSSIREITTKRELAERICHKLNAAGEAATPEEVCAVIDHWVAGHRVPDLPGGIIAIATSVILERIDRHLPGSLARLQ